MENFPAPHPVQEAKESDPLLCAHGTDRGSVCLACLQESKKTQPIWDKIEGWKKDSKYTRSDDLNPECRIERGGSVYYVSMVKGDDIETFNKLQALLVETFGSEEVDPLDITIAAVKGLRRDGSQDVARYRIYVAKDEEGKIQSLYQSGLVDILRDGKPTNEKIMMGAYGVTREEKQGQGLAREMYISSMMQGAADAHSQGKELTMIAGECTSKSERAWGAMGRRRVYVQTGENEYTEVKYVQPALDYDPETGLALDPDTGQPREGAGESPEHLMVQFLKGEPTKQRVSEAVDSMYRWCNRWRREQFNSDEAFATHNAYVDRVKKEFDDLLTNSGEMKLLSPEDREELRSKGVTINEYIEADHTEEEEGSENA